MTERLKVWIVDDDQSVRWVMDQALTQAGMLTRVFDSAQALLQTLETDKPAVVVTDVRMPDMTGMTLMSRLAASHPELPVIVMTAHSDLDSAVAAYRGGAFEYLPKPFDVDEAVRLVERAADKSSAAIPDDAAAKPALSNLIGRAPAMQEVFRTIGRLANSSMTVLVTGESGTGKELVARALHQHSPRARRPFIALNTSAIASELLESELFGHERGAFTGAEARRVGRFEQADGGTLFLDEIGDMSAALQTRLLRVLAESEFYRVGGQAAIKVDVRVIAATNQNLARAVTDGRLREDLFHRLNVIHIETPPLRQRREDIALLLTHYLRKASEELRIQRKTLSDDALQALASFPWPGNVRQLVNACRLLTVTAPGNTIGVGDIPAELGGRSEGRSAGREWVTALARWAEMELGKSNGKTLLEVAGPDFERTLIRAALAKANGHRQQAAKYLGWGRNTLARKIRELGLK